MPPERTNLVLASDIPDGEGDVLVFNSLDVETCHHEPYKFFTQRKRAAGLTDCGDGGDDLTELELVQDCCLTGSVETNLWGVQYSEQPVVKRRARARTINIPASCQRRQHDPSFGFAVIDGDYARISFLPKRPERRRETERPIVARCLESKDRERR